MKRMFLAKAQVCCWPIRISPRLAAERFETRELVAVTFVL